MNVIIIGLIIIGLLAIVIVAMFQSKETPLQKRLRQRRADLNDRLAAAESDVELQRINKEIDDLEAEIASGTKS